MSDRISSVARRLARLRVCSLIALAGLIFFVAGCNPQALSMLFMPFSDNKIPPEYKLCPDKKEVTVAILLRFAQDGIHVREEIKPAEIELPELVAQYFRQRCMENKQKIKIVPQNTVNDYLLKENLDAGESCAQDLGKHVKANYVVDLTINSMQIYQEKSFPKMFRGSSQIAIVLYKMDVKDGDNRVFNKIFSFEFPGDRGPIDAGNTPPAQFRRMYLDKMARELTKTFIAFDPDERHRVDS